MDSPPVKLKKRTPTNKHCGKCREMKPASEFYKDRTKASGLASFCKECTFINRKAWRAARGKDDVNEENAIYKRKKPFETRSYQIKHRWKKLGIDLDGDKVIAQLEEQSYLCAICKDDISFEYYHYDHDHTTGKLRKILCPPCNKGIGHFNDDPHLLSLAIKYLQEN